MERNPIDFNNFQTDLFSLFAEDWFLLTAGDFKTGDFNAMTVSWGTIGIIWGKPVFMAMVRPGRHTFKFIEKYSDFTIAAFPSKYKEALKLCGVRSGRDTDKVKLSGLTPCESSLVAAPSYEEAKLILECRKIYTDKLHPENFVLPSIEDHYKDKDYHTLYYGEIIRIEGTKEFSNR